MKRADPSKVKSTSTRKAARTKPSLDVILARLAKLERRVDALERRDEALDHSIEELAAAWVPESK